MLTWFFNVWLVLPELVTVEISYLQCSTLLVDPKAYITLDYEPFV